MSLFRKPNPDHYKKADPRDAEIAELRAQVKNLRTKHDKLASDLVHGPAARKLAASPKTVVRVTATHTVPAFGRTKTTVFTTRSLAPTTFKKATGLDVDSIVWSSDRSGSCEFRRDWGSTKWSVTIEEVK